MSHQYRTVNGSLKASILDHIYTTNPLKIKIKQLNHDWPVFTDHALIYFEIGSNKSEPDETLRRDWRIYNKDSLCRALAGQDWDFKSDSVQSYWDKLENQLINILK